MEQTDKFAVRNLVFGTVLGIILSGFPIGTVLMTVPVLLVCPRIERRTPKVLAFAALLLGTIAWTVFQNRAILGTEYWPVLLVGLYLPVSVVLGSFIWAIGASYSKSSMRKFFWCAIPVYVLGSALGLYFASELSQGIRDILYESVMYYFQAGNLAVDVSTVVRTVIDTMMVYFAPMGIVALMLPVAISDINIHRYDEDWQYDFANMKLPDPYVWVFFASWALALASMWIPSVPAWVLALAWNLALTLTMLYFIVGVSILVSFARRRTAVITAGRIVFTVFLLCMIPFVNVALVVGLPIMAVLETWVKFR